MSDADPRTPQPCQAAAIAAAGGATPDPPRLEHGAPHAHGRRQALPIRQLHNFWLNAASKHVRRTNYNDNKSFDENTTQLILIMGMGGLALRNMINIAFMLDVHIYSEYTDVAKHMVGGYYSEDLFYEVQYYIANFFVQFLLNSNNPARSSIHFNDAHKQLDGTHARISGTAIMTTIRNT
jgi:hypothetical protein